MKTRLAVIFFLVLVTGTVTRAGAPRFHTYFTDNMVLQREKPVMIKGWADPGIEVIVTFAGQIRKAKTEADGSWAVTLDPLNASAEGRKLICKAGTEVAIENVVVGDVWFFGRQTFVDISLRRSEQGKADASAYQPKGTFRAIRIRTIPEKKPLADLGEEVSSGWVDVNGDNVLALSGAAFYLGRDLTQALGVPIGVVDVNMSHYFGIGWLSEKALADAARIHPNSSDIASLPDSMRKETEARDSGKAQKDLDAYYEKVLEKAKGKPTRGKPSLGLHPLMNPMYPSAGYNAVIHPLQGIAWKGVLLQLGNDYPYIAYGMLARDGKNGDQEELNTAFVQNYMILKVGYRSTPLTLPYVVRDWRRTLGDQTLPVGLILPPSSDLDVYAAHNREVRELHRRTSEKEENVGLILPGMSNIPFSGQPKDDVLLAERCKAWVLGAASGVESVAPTGPLFARIDANLRKATVYFKNGTAKGLKATVDTLQGFETAGPDRAFVPAEAVVDGETIKLKSTGPIQFVRYNWTEHPAPVLVNGAGLPALPFSTDPDWAFAWIPPTVKPNLPVEYTTTADKWGHDNVAIVNGQIANLRTGDSEPIPLRPGPIGIVASPFGPNIYVKDVDLGSPADGKIFPGDVIYGVNGTVFDSSPGVESDKQYHALADAITFTETEEGKGDLTLSLRRGAETMDVTLKLKVLGSYSVTTPYHCKKSESIVKNAEAWITRSCRPENGMPSEAKGMLHSDLLFLLATGNPDVQGLVRRAVYRRMADMKPKPVTSGMASKPWSTGHQSMLFGEYFHATGDRAVLPYLKYQVDLSCESQIKPQAETPPNKEAAQTEAQVGGWRHNYVGTPDRWQSGYGLLPHAGMGCVMGMQLAKEAGVPFDETSLAYGLRHFNKGRAEYAYVIYTYWDLRTDGPPQIDPGAEAAGMLSSMNGKLGMAAALFDMVNYKATTEICARHCVYGFNNTRTGHGGMFFNNFWTPIGAWASGEKGFKHFMKNQIWWRELFRRHDGSFNQAGRGRIGVSYALPYVAPKRRLRMLGAPRSAFGANPPEYLKEALAAHTNRQYEKCETLILARMNGVLPAEDLPMVKHLLESVQILRKSIDHDLALTEKMIEEGKYFYASLELPQLKAVVPGDDPRLKAIVDALGSAEGMKKIAEHQKTCKAMGKAHEAGNRNRRENEGRWVDLVAEASRNTPGATWRMALVEHIRQAPAKWTTPTFADSAWDKTALPTSWRMYHTALLRTTFKVEDKKAIDALKIRGGFLWQTNVVVHLNGELVAKIDNIGSGERTTEAVLTDRAMELLQEGENTLAISTRHTWRWGSMRGTYPSAGGAWMSLSARLAEPNLE